MTTLKLLLAEIRYRKLNFALSLFAVVMAVGLFVAGPMLVEGYRRETNDQVNGLEAGVVELEQAVADMKASVAEEQEHTAATLALMADETRRLMLGMGFNLMIVHQDTNMADFWAADFATADMPQEYVQILADTPQLTLVTHLVATLQQKIEWEGRKVLLVGYLPESTQSHMRKKAPMGYQVESGTVLLGYELGRDRKPGEMIAINGPDGRARELRIAGILQEMGSKEDITLAVHLQDAQYLLDKPDRVNQIMALGCHCADSQLALIRQQLAEILPDTRITEFRSIALARAKERTMVAQEQERILANMAEKLEERRKTLDQRKETLAAMAGSRARIQRTVETLTNVITPLVILASAVWVGLLGLANVRERRSEIGLLRALGKSSLAIGSLFLGKAVLIGLLGAIVGSALGAGLGAWLGTNVLQLAADQVNTPWAAVLPALIGAPLVSAMAGYPPTLFALLQDPAVVLRDR